MKKLLVIVIVLFSMNSNTYAQNWTEIVQKSASDHQTSGYYGCSIDVDGNIAVVGSYAQYLNENGGDSLEISGAAYILEFDGTNWNEVQKIVASDRKANAYFGYDVAINNGYIAIGAPGESLDANGADSIPGAGSVYIFEQQASGTWVEMEKLVSYERSMADAYGRVVDLDGDYLAISAVREDEGLTAGNSVYNSGAVYIYKLSGASFGFEQKLVASDRGASDEFGYSIALQGNRLVVGAHYEDEDENGLSTFSYAGSAYIFSRTGSVWTEDQKIVASDRAEQDVFGSSVAIDNDVIVVGAIGEDEDETGSNFLSGSGSVYVFSYSGTNWIESQKIVASDRAYGDKFGTSVALDNGVLLVGAKNASDTSGGVTTFGAGASYVFRNDGSSWNEEQQLVASDKANSDHFGQDVTIDGDNIFVSTMQKDHGNYTDVGSVYIFSSECIITTSVTSNGTLLTADLSGATYQWIDCADNTPISGATNQSFSPSTNGNYAVIVSDNNCTDTSDCIAINNLGLSTKTILSDQYIVYPNPTKDEITIEFGQAHSAMTVTVISAIGKEQKIIDCSNVTSAKLNLKDLNPGVYFLLFKGDSTRSVQEIIKY